MNASVRVWEKWHQQVKEMLAGVHGHQKKALALMVMDMVLSGSAVLQRMAEDLQSKGISRAKMPSIERRLARFVANERVVVSTVWKHFLTPVLVYWKGKPARLVLDWTPFDDRATIVYLGLLVHSRVLPLAWRVMPNQEKWDQGQWELVGELLDEVSQHLEPTDCTVIADHGLAGFALVKLCRDRQFHYLLRRGFEHTCRRWMRKGWTPWCALEHIIRTRGQQWFGRVLLWQDQTIETSLSAVWDPECKEAWLLISDHPAGRSRVQEYALRMRVESTFQDQKSRGWNLEASLIDDRQRLNRLLLTLFLAMWWVSHLAASCIHQGKRDQCDRHGRRDKSIFRLGRLWLLDILQRARSAAPLIHCLPFQKLAARLSLCTALLSVPTEPKTNTPPILTTRGILLRQCSGPVRPVGLEAMLLCGHCPTHLPPMPCLSDAIWWPSSLFCLPDLFSLALFSSQLPLLAYNASGRELNPPPDPTTADAPTALEDQKQATEPSATQSADQGQAPDTPSLSWA